MMSTSPYSLGFTTLSSETSLSELTCEGHVPDWLRGCLVRTGPAAFEAGAQPYVHWFDGLAMLHRFNFTEGRVEYANRFLQSQSYRSAKQHGVVGRSEFATDPHRNWLRKLLPAIRRSASGDNGNVNISRFGDSMVALTETPVPIRFEPSDLTTLSAYRYEDALAGQITTAHPQHDDKRRCQFNYLLEFGRTSKYHIYRLDDGSASRQPIATIPVQRPAYMHSFGMSDRYLILTEFPLVVNPLQLLLGHQPFIEHYRWEPERGTVFHIIDKDSGQVVKTARSEPFFAFHHVNAFEEGDDVVVDLVAFPDAAVIDQFYLNHLRSSSPVTATGHLKRFRIRLDAGDAIASETLAETPLEFPRFNERTCAMRPYRYVYGASSQSRADFMDNLIKLDIRASNVSVWQQPDCYPGEPVFVAAPQSNAEDEGVILSVVLDSAASTSFLLVLDAQSFTEHARLMLPHHVPFGFHGNFYKPTSA